ncbi:MAG: GDSL-type esterase/lipase family protein [Actinomycetota bacterium]|nr:GDSL-type esterase/lipase family protein [Actinomycetota bacterium]
MSRSRPRAASLLATIVAAATAAVTFAAVPATAEPTIAAPPDRMIVAVDVSASMEVGAGEAGDPGDCNRDGSVDDNDDLNGDDRTGTALDCAVAAVLALTTELAPAWPSTRLSIIVFGDDAAVADLGEPTGDANPLDEVLGPLAERVPGDRDRTADVTEAIASVRTGGIDLHRPVEVGRQSRLDALVDRVRGIGPGDGDQVVVLSRTGSTLSMDDLAEASALGVPFHTFALGPEGACSESLAALADATGTVCGALGDPLGLATLLVPSVEPAEAEPVERPDTITYVALGDSYSAGEGLDNDRETDELLCHRAAEDAYPGLLARRLEAETGRPVQLDLAACSGAMMRHVLADEQHLDGLNPPQLEALDASTELVTITMGGNDLGFSEIGLHCATQLRCPDDGYVSLAEGPDPTLAEWVDRRLPLLQVELTALYRAIAARAPDATIVALGYPRPISAAPQRLCRIRWVLDDYERQFLRSVADRLEAAVLGAARAAGVYGIGVTEAFAGREACARRSGADEWINGHVLDASDLVGPGTFHPNRAGHEAYAALLTDWFVARP